MSTVPLLDPSLQFESRRVPVDQLPGMELGSELQNTLAHMAAVEGDTTKLLEATDGALHVAGPGFDALVLALVGAGDKGLDDVIVELQDDLSHVTFGTVIEALDDIRTAVEETTNILTDVWDAVDHHLEVSYTP